MNEDQIDFQEILENLGYELDDRGDYWQTNALYRDGDNKTALQIYKDSGVWKDYVEDTQFLPFEALLSQKGHNLTREEISKILKNKQASNLVEKPIKQELVASEEIFDEEILKDLLPHYKFYENKNINISTLKSLDAGLSTQGQMYQRFVFPIRNEYGQIHGFAGRDMSQSSNRPKWKHIGRKTKWIYPYFNLKFKNNNLDWNSKQIILVESIGDMLSLRQNLQLNCLVTFGLDISPALINCLLLLNPSKIFISLNNDNDKAENRGLNASIKNYLKLLSFFDWQKIKICLPFNGDFGDMLPEDFSDWKNKLLNINDKDQRHDVRHQAEKLITNNKLSKNIYKNLKFIT